MADAGHAVLLQGSLTCTGHFVDEDVLGDGAIVDLDPYRMVPGRSRLEAHPFFDPMRGQS